MALSQLLKRAAVIGAHHAHAQFALT